MENLREELTCFICMDYFTGPVTTEYWHSFCLVCLLRSWEEHNTPLSCPECWRTLEIPHFQPSEHLGKLVGISKQLRSRVLQSEGNQGSYERMLAAAKVLSDDEQGVKDSSTQGHGINRMNLSNEAEEHHKVRLAAWYKFQNTNQVPSLNSHNIFYGWHSWVLISRHQTTNLVWVLLHPLIKSLSHLVPGPQDPFMTWCSAHLPQSLFLLQEKLQEILNILRKKKNETQVILTHEKERVILCKVSIWFTFASCMWFYEED